MHIVKAKGQNGAAQTKDKNSVTEEQMKKLTFARLFEALDRRKMLRWVPDKIWLKIKWNCKMGTQLDLKNPRTFNEKLQWLKIYGREAEDTIMVDKYLVKEYVAEKIGLSGSPYESVEILCNKDRFRAFLKEHGFCTPEAKGYTAVADAVADLEAGVFKYPVIVKPVDSAGSKGVTRVDAAIDLSEALDIAFVG